MSNLTLYSMPSSGNSYKVRLLLALLGRDYRHVSCETQSAELERAKAEGQLPLGKLPALHLGDGTILSESNAILWYLGAGSDWVPSDALTQAQMLGWMFFEQNRYEPVVAVRASLNTYPHLKDEATPEVMAKLLQEGHALLHLMEDHLQGRAWFAGASPSLADIALYAYTHTAGERGGFEMNRFPLINGWCARVAALPGYAGLFDHG
ncbi:glutathione S-transferase family protein [Roseovarius sp. A21]|uniref:Glutathione S-transferase family protein n=1 Tax=Roseovarius bejariae TaxID=2576383 RepID=A0A844CYX1_9RHOB|nr:glutathione S-transferase family protein [Roseovarius bejariae]MRU16296.1 glutathione S-transferase family protein [Roseovarius bejariae]